MERTDIEDVFRAVGRVTVRRMFGGWGISLDGVFFALGIGGEIYLKTNNETQSAFLAAGSSPFIYHAKSRPVTTSYWRAPAAALDDPEAMRPWASLALAAARRAPRPTGQSRRAPSRG